MLQLRYFNCAEYKYNKSRKFRIFNKVFRYFVIKLKGGVQNFQRPIFRIPTISNLKINQCLNKTILSLFTYSVCDEKVKSSSHESLKSSE